MFDKCVVFIFPIMEENAPTTATSQGPKHSLGCYARLVFDADKEKYEQCKVKFLGYMQLQKLKDITAPDKVDAEKNKERFAELNIIT